MVGCILWQIWHDMRFLQTLLMCPFSIYFQKFHFFHVGLVLECSTYFHFMVLSTKHACIAPSLFLLHFHFAFSPFRDGGNSGSETAPPIVLVLRFKFGFIIHSHLNISFTKYRIKHSTSFLFNEAQEIFKLSSSAPSFLNITNSCPPAVTQLKGNLERIILMFDAISSSSS